MRVLYEIQPQLRFAHLMVDKLNLGNIQNMKYISLLFIVMFIFSCEAMSQVCPFGAYPGRLDEPQICLPPPNDDSQSPQSGARWATRWGAIALDGSKGILGAVTGAKSKKLANKAAIAQCRANGGGDNCKKAPLIYSNQCAAIAWGDTTYRGGGRPTLEEAKKDAMKSCSNATTSCKIVYADCSLAERVQ